METTFPDVPRIDAAALAGMLARDEAQRPILVDVRTEAEFAVSHLPGARRLDPDLELSAEHPLVTSKQPIVLYCSVGHRSSKQARNLLRLGKQDVANLRDGIFGWVREGRPLERSDGQPEARVHPYDAFWERLLAPEHVAAVSSVHGDSDGHGHS